LDDFHHPSFYPELANHPITADMNVFALKAIETVEE
jgi:hypothetical protein